MCHHGRNTHRNLALHHSSCFYHFPDSCFPLSPFTCKTKFLYICCLVSHLGVSVLSWTSVPRLSCYAERIHPIWATLQDMKRWTGRSSCSSWEWFALERNSRNRMRRACPGVGVVQPVSSELTWNSCFHRASAVTLATDSHIRIIVTDMSDLRAKSIFPNTCWIFLPG